MMLIRLHCLEVLVMVEECLSRESVVRCLGAPQAVLPEILFMGRKLGRRRRRALFSRTPDLAFPRPFRAASSALHWSFWGWRRLLGWCIHDNLRRFVLLDLAQDF